MSTFGHTVELLADELVRLVGWGADPRRCATKATLGQLSEVDPDLSPTTAGCIVARYLREAVRSFDGPQEFLGRQYGPPDPTAGVHA
jgi:hypothetical protein